MTKTGLQPSLARQPINYTNPVIPSRITRSISQPGRTLPTANTKSSRPETATSVGTVTTSRTTAKPTTSKVVKAPPLSTGLNTKTITATKNAPVQSTHHKSAVSLSSRPTGTTTRVATSTVRRPHTVLDTNKKRDKPSGAHGALMLVKDIHIHGDVISEDFLFDM